MDSKKTSELIRIATKTYSNEDLKTLSQAVDCSAQELKSLFEAVKNKLQDKEIINFKKLSENTGISTEKIISITKTISTLSHKKTLTPYQVSSKHKSSMQDRVSRKEDHPEPYPRKPECKSRRSKPKK